MKQTVGAFRKRVDMPELETLQDSMAHCMQQTWAVGGYAKAQLRVGGLRGMVASLFFATFRIRRAAFAYTGTAGSDDAQASSPGSTWCGYGPSLVSRGQ